MKLHHLQQLMKAFVNHRPDGVIIQEASSYFPSKVKEREPGLMNLEEFKTTVSRVLKTDEYDEYLEKLFLKVYMCCCDIIKQIFCCVRDILFNSLPTL